MKKLIFALCIALAFAVCSPAAFAENGEDRLGEYDSASVGEEIAARLGVNEGDVIYKIYNCGVVIAFGHYDSVGEILKSDRILRINYAVLKKGSADDGWKFYNGASGDLDEITIDSTTAGTMRALTVLKNESRIKEVTGAKEINEVFFFYNPTMRQGTAIYYKTDKGDYVYYDRSGTGNYMFTADEFFGIMKEAYAKMGPDVPPGGSVVSLLSDVDFSKYDMDSPGFSLADKNGNGTNRLIPVCIAVFAAAAFCFAAAAYKKRKKRG